jgi:protocatechuate 3,4-dioxygenase beta subunit
MYKIYLLFICLLLTVSCVKSQNSNIIGGPCEGCEAIYEYGNATLSSEVTLPDYAKGDDKIVIRGTVYKKDGETPASDVILYVYQTNAYGKYPKKDNATGWGARHGYLRAWLKTDSTGGYTFFTNRPASYPNSTIPQHIHITVKEPDKSEYYVEDFYFADDKHITPNIVNRARPRGGSGVISLKQKGDLSEGYRDIILGLNIPNYPE